jgi:hypothetical protein
VDKPVRKAARGTGRVALEIAAAVFVGAAVPLFWIWVGSQIQGSRGAQGIEGTTVAILIVGIVSSYIAILIIAAAIQARSDDAAGKRPHRFPWLRSMRDEPYRPGARKLTPVEAVFVSTAVIASIAMMIWFFAFAGSPLPN